MALICQNCGSNDVVAIQGQEFCINCGSVVVVPKSAQSAPAIPKPAPKPATSAPTSAELPHSIPVTRAVAIKRLSLMTPEPVAKASTQATAKTGVPEPVPASRQAVTPPARPSNHQPAATDRPHHTPINHDIKAHPLSYTLKLSLALGTVVAASIGGGLWLGLDNDIMVYLSLVSGLAVLVLLLLSQSALLYGLSRAQDGRATPRKQWWAVARGSFLEVLNADLLTLITQFLMGFAAYSLWQAYLRVHGSSNYLDVAMLALGNLVIAWVLLGSLAARRIAVPAVVIGNLNGIKAVKLGWRCYLRAGGHLILALAETWMARMVVILVLVTGAVAANHYYGNVAGDALTAWISGGLFVSIVALFMLILQAETPVWLKQYRQWVDTYLASQRLKLLSGRHHKRR